MKKFKNRSKEVNTAKAIPICIGINMGVFLSFSLIACALLYTGKDPTGNISLYSMITFIASGAAGSFIGAKATSARISIISSAVCAGIYICIALILGGNASGRALMNALCFMLSSALLAVIGGAKRAKRRARKSH